MIKEAAWNTVERIIGNLQDSTTFLKVVGRYKKPNGMVYRFICFLENQ